MAKLKQSEILQLARWNTPTIYNGWEQITKCDSAKDCFNLEETRDFTPEMGPMCGYAVTLTIGPSRRGPVQENPGAWLEFIKYLASVSGPKIVVCQDLDKPNFVGTFCGEVTAGIYRALGCTGAIIDGTVRDIDEVKAVGFKLLAQRFCVGHANAWPLKWNCEVEVFGRKVQPGDLIHADKHGFMAIGEEDQQGLLDAAIFMDNNELNTVIAAGRESAGSSSDEVVAALEDAAKRFNAAVEKKFGRRGEW
jgi:4-hydroxy-4-methyl-2-oxoglutarate aldolase